MQTIDFLYIIKTDVNDISTFQRLSCSIKSVLNNDYQNTRICISDVSNQPLFKYLINTIKIPFEYVWKSQKGPYNRSNNINFGVKTLIKSEFFFISDLDIIYPKNHIEKHLLQNQYKLIFSKVIRLENEFISSDYDLLAKQQQGQIIPIGGICYCQKQLFFELNGYDEIYEGWGAEDDDFRIRASMLTKILTPLESIISTVFHLWHQPFISNQKILFDYRDKNSKLFFENKEKYLNGILDPRKVNPYGWGL